MPPPTTHRAWQLPAATYLAGNELQTRSLPHPLFLDERPHLGVMLFEGHLARRHLEKVHGVRFQILPVLLFRHLFQNRQIAAHIMAMDEPLLARARTELRDDGFTIFRRAVEEDLLTAARRVIQRALGEAAFSDPKVVDSANGLQLPSIMSDAAVVGLWSRSALSVKILPALIGAPLEPVSSGQIALRFPGTGCLAGTFCADPGVLSPAGWHIDGLPGALPHFTPGTIHNFTALVGVALADVGPAPNCGGLTVFPRGHRALNEHLNAVGLADLLQRGQAALPHNTLPLAPPKQVSLRAGDAVVVHFLMPHAVAPNCFGAIREVVYFRVSSAPGDCRPLALLDMWAEWPALRNMPTSVVPAVAPADAAAAAARAAGAAAFDMQDWSTAALEYACVAAARPEDFEAAFKSGAAATFAAAYLAAAGDAPRAREVAATGGTLLARACSIAPALAWAHAVRARNAALQARWSEALSAARDAVGGVGAAASELAALDAAQPWQAQLLRDGLIAAEAAADALKTPQAARQLRAAAELRFPADLRPAVAAGAASTGEDADVAAMPSSSLWATGVALIKSEPKAPRDWARARAIFTRLASLQPGIMWAAALAGICCAFAPGSTRSDGAAAVEYARAAAAADPASPIPHALLCRATLVADGSGGIASGLAALASLLFSAPPSAHAALAVREAFAAFVTRPCDGSYTPAHEHSWLLLDAVRCVKRCATGEQLATLLREFATTFPGLQTAARHV